MAFLEEHSQSGGLHLTFQPFLSSPHPWKVLDFQQSFLLEFKPFQYQSQSLNYSLTLADSLGSMNIARHSWQLRSSKAHSPFLQRTGEEGGSPRQRETTADRSCEGRESIAEKKQAELESESHKAR